MFIQFVSQVQRSAERGSQGVDREVIANLTARPAPKQPSPFVHHLRVGPNERKLDGPESRRLTDVRRGGSFRERGLREQGGIGGVIKGLRVILYPQSGSVTGDEKIRKRVNGTRPIESWKVSAGCPLECEPS